MIFQTKARACLMAEKTIKKRNLDQEIYNRIIEKIVNAEYEQGQQIFINDLVEELGVSRTPVVQAVKMLNTDGVFVVTNTGKVFLPEFSKKQIADIYEVRLLLEKYAIAQLCTGRKNKTHLEYLQRINHECCERLENNEIVEYRKKDLFLHRSLIELTDNQCLITSYIKVQNQFMVANYLLGTHGMHHQMQSISEHKKLLQAIENENEQEAVLVIEQHINRALSRIM